MTIREQESYVQGLEDGINIVKRMLELDMNERKLRFGEYDISKILDKFDFAQIREKMIERLEKKYVIRGIKVNDYNQKRVVAESDPLTFKPDELLINAFLNCHKDKNIKFVSVEEIWINGCNTVAKA